MELYSPTDSVKLIKNKIGSTGVAAFFTTLVVGILTHMPALVSEIPNHDGLQSMYFDQNMITSGRFFLGLACGISSYYYIPWLTGILAIFYLSIASILLIKVLNVKNPLIAGLMGALLVTFPVIASDFAYVFTMDGYLLGVLLAILSVYLVKNFKYGFIFGGVALSLSMGIYQAYLPLAIILSMYMVMVRLFEESDDSVSKRITDSLKYLYMGVIGAGLYYLLLNILLKIQGKELDTYQGIDSLGATGGFDLIKTLKSMVSDFVIFSLKGNVLFNNGVTACIFICFMLVSIVSLIALVIKRKLYKNIFFYIALAVFVLIMPLACNVIFVISPEVNYHLLMRYQWVLLYIIGLSLADKTLNLYSFGNMRAGLLWAVLFSSVLASFSFAVQDNIAYSNLHKKYEKTYSYAVRLLDRMETTEGYYPGIPVYMIGVIGDKNYPVTDITGQVTESMIGLNGDFLIYQPENYALFFKYYLGTEVNFVDINEYRIYFEDWYQEMPSFPMTGSVVIKDGIMIVKTENKNE